MMFGIFSSAALHIPDGFLSIPIAIVGLLIAAAVLGIALRQTGKKLGERQIPILGVMAAFVFAAQAINFPIFGGTSGHLLGAALLTIVVGPWPAVLVMTVVVGLQALLFQDGGLLALGWNMINMAAVGVLTAALVYGLLRRILGENRRSLIISTATASWFSVVLSATAVGAALAMSDPGLFPAIPAMAGVHMVIGVGEALITVAAVLLISRSRPELVDEGPAAGSNMTAYSVGAILLAALLASVLSVLSSPNPDGLESVAIDYGFAEKAIEPVLEIIPDYTVPGVTEAFGGIAAVLIGVAAALLLMALIGFTLLKIRSKSSIGQPPASATLGNMQSRDN